MKTTGSTESLEPKGYVQDIAKDEPLIHALNVTVKQEIITPMKEEVGVGKPIIDSNEESIVEANDILNVNKRKKYDEEFSDQDQYNESRYMKKNTLNEGKEKELLNIVPSAEVIHLSFNHELSYVTYIRIRYAVDMLTNCYSILFSFIFF